VIIRLCPIQGIGAHEAQTKEHVEVCHALPPVGHTALVRLGLSGRYAGWGDIIDSAEDEGVVCRVVETRSGENRGEEEAGSSADPSYDWIGCGLTSSRERAGGWGRVGVSSRAASRQGPIAESAQCVDELRLLRLLGLDSPLCGAFHRTRSKRTVTASAPSCSAQK
jgi:hypothetical protein